MAMVCEKRDLRPRNPEHQREIEQMFASDKLKEINMNDIDSLDHSIDEIDDTQDFEEWTRRKVIGSNYDPAMHKPVQISESPISDYNIEFTRLNKTTDNITPSSLSSLVIPQTSNASLTITNSSTPSKSIRASRLPTTTPKTTINFTPARILQEKQKRKVERRTSRGTRSRNGASLMDGPFASSTPIRNVRSKASFFDRMSDVAAAPIESIASIPSEEAASKVQDSGDNILSPVETERTLTNENQDDEGSATVIPETQNNDSVIPETQANESVIPETQENDSIIPETQANESVIPETQDLPETQEEANHPVQAQVTTQNPAKQAEPQNDDLENSKRRIQSRPPIHGQFTPSVARHTPKTPSRLPIPISQTPKLIRKTALTPIPHHVDAMPSSVAARPTPIAAETPTRPRIVVSPPTVIPAPPANVTVNVNVSNSMPQSPSQIAPTVQRNDQTHTLNTRDEHGSNVGDAPNGRSATARSPSNSSLLTDDDSEEVLSNESERCETPKSAANNNSVSRKLFPDENDQYRRSATFDKIPSPLPNQQPGLSFRTRSTNAIALKSPNIGSTTRSETFVKQKTPNVTYDIPIQSVPRRNSRMANETDEFPSSYVTNTTNNSNMHTNTFGTGLNLPSEALISMESGSIDLTEDEEANVNNVNKSNGSSEPSVAIGRNTRSSSRQPNESNNTNQSQIRIRKSYADKTLSKANVMSVEWNPAVQLHRIEDVQPSTSKSIRNPSMQRASGLNLRDSQPFGPVPPPDGFDDDSDDDIGDIHEGSPTTSQREFDAPIRKTAPEKSAPRKRAKREKSQDLVVVEQNMKKLNAKKRESGKKKRSGGSTSRRLRSLDSIHDTVTVETVENMSAELEIAEASNASQVTSTTNDTFKRPDAPAPRRTRRNKNKESSDSSAESQDEFVVTYEVDPVNDDEFPSVHVDDNEPSTSNRSAPKRKMRNQPKKAPATTANKSSRSKSKAKEPQTAQKEPEEQSNDATASSITIRRSSRDRNSNLNPQLSRMSLLTILKAQHSGKRKSKEPVNEPPNKRPRANTEQGYKMNRPAASRGTDVVHKIVNKRMPSSSTIVHTTRASTTTSMHHTRVDDINDIQEFTRGKEKALDMMKKDKFYKELLNIQQKDPIYHNAEEVDVEHVRFGRKQIEISSTDKVEYGERNGVDYGFIPSAISKYSGLMRFPPNAVKDKQQSHSDIMLAILYGEFTIQCDDTLLEVSAGTDVMVPRGASYGLRNRGDHNGIVYFVYAKARPQN